jgi:hypothetical protein
MGDWSTRSAVWTSSALFTRCLLVQSVHRQAALPGMGYVSAHRGRAGETSCLFLSILRGVLFLASICGPLNFYRASMIFPQPARPRLARRRRWGPDAGAPHVRIGGAAEGNLSFLLHQLSKDEGRRATPMAWRSTACSSPRLYGLVR